MSVPHAHASHHRIELDIHLLFECSYFQEVFDSLRYVSILKEYVVNGYDVSVATKGLSYQLELLVLLFYFLY